MNIGYMFYEICQALLGLGQKLVDVFTAEISIKWVKNILNFFGGSVDLPDTISLLYIITGGSAILILTIIIYRLFK